MKPFVAPVSAIRCARHLLPTPGEPPPHGSSDPEECRATGASVGVGGIVTDIGGRVGDFYGAYPQRSLRLFGM